MIFTNKNRLDFNEATEGWICDDLLGDDFKKVIITTSETTVISRESIAALPIENATSNAKSQSSLQLYSKIWPIMTHICS